MHTTNYANTFIAVSPDTVATAGRVPEKAGSVAALQWAMIHAAPYTYTSDDVIFAVHAERKEIAEADRAAARAAFFSKGQPCLRSSPLVKTHGWGVHHDDKGRVALVGRDSAAYAAMSARQDLTIVAGMRSKRAPAK